MSHTDYQSIRSVLETPVMDERKWAKVPGIPSDAVLVDMEDALPLSRKEEGRVRAVELLGDRSLFGDRVVIARPNHLTTPWGRDDTIAIASVDPPCVMYPMGRSVCEILEFQRLLRDHDCDPDIIVCVETPQAVAAVEALAAVPRVVGLVFGEGDLSAEMGIVSRRPDGGVNPTILQQRIRTLLAAHANGLAALDAAFVLNVRDLDEYRRQCRELVDLGATGLIAIYPPQVDIHLELLTPTPDQQARAREVVAIFEAAVADGRPAVQLEGGQTILIHDYAKAKRVLTRSAR